MFDCDEAIYWVNSTQVIVLISNEKGEFLWCNSAFESFIKYSRWELVGDDNHEGVKWTDISVDDTNLEADIIMAKECAIGTRKKYLVKKQYVPKGEKPVWVELEVMRYPYEGDFKYFIVTVNPFKNGTLTAFNFSMNRIEALTKELASLKDSMDEVPEVFVKKLDEKERTKCQKISLLMADFIDSHPKIAFIIFIVLLTSLIGGNTINTFKEIIPLLGF